MDSIRNIDVGYSLYRNDLIDSEFVANPKRKSLNREEFVENDVLVFLYLNAREAKMLLALRLKLHLEV